MYDIQKGVVIANGPYIRELAAKAGIQRKKLAVLANLSDRQIDRMFASAKVRPDTLKMMADALGVRTQDLIKGCEPERADQIKYVISLTVECVEYEQFLQLTEALSDIQKTIRNHKNIYGANPYSFHPVVDKYFLRCGDEYALVLTSSNNQYIFMQCINEGILPDFAIAVLTGRGDPDEELRIYIEKRWGYSRYAPLSYLDLITLPLLMP